MRIRLASLALAVGLLASMASAQTTGTASGRVSDENGSGLPGVGVEAKGPALQGTQNATTDNNGAYRLPLLPPGRYEISATLQGFATEKRTVTIALGANSTADFTLRPRAAAEVTVTAEAPVVDTKSAATGYNLDQTKIEILPTQRNYSSLAQVTPGVSVQSSNTATFANTITVYGSSGLENSFVIDGVDTNGIEYGTQGKELNYELVQEIEVKTGGYQAEYGRSTGGIINVITKSGGNDFHGGVFGYYTTDSLQANNKHPNETLFGTSEGFSRADGGIDLGGYFLKDRIWFFGAYDRVKNIERNTLTSGPNEGELVASPSVRNLGSGKVTFSILPNLQFVASYFQDPRVDTGAINDGAHTLNGPPSTFLGRQDFGGRDYSGRFTATFGDSWVATLQTAIHQERNSVGPATAAGQGIQYVDTRNNNLQSGGFGLVQQKEFKRYFDGISLTKYLGGHEIKGGFEFERETAQVLKRMSGGQQVTIFDNPDDPSMPVYNHYYWSVPNATCCPPDQPLFIPISQLNANPEHKAFTVYLQDNWQVLPNLTVNAGVRWDRQQIYDSSGIKQIDLKKDFAPRFGFIFDPTKDHRSKVYGSFGRFYEEIPMDLVIRSYSYERQPYVFNFDPVDTTPDPAADAIANGSSTLKGGFTEPSDPNLHGQYVREFTLGAEREVIPDLAVGVRYIYRNYGEVIEDFACQGDGSYCIGNPGEGIMRRIYSLAIYNDPPDFTTYAAPKAKRIYRGIQLDVTKRFSKNFSALASYLWSKLDGNYDGEFAPFTQQNGTADPNISAAYDYYNFFTNGGNINRITNNGPLSNDTRSQFKLSGVYVTPFRLNVGLSAYYRTGSPLTRYGFSNDYLRYEYFLQKRGSEGRTPSTYEADLHLGYPLGIGPVTIDFLFDVFNLLNVQRAVALDERYNLSQFDDASYVCGSSPGSADEERCNPYYGKPVQRTAPRQVRFGARISF